MEPTYIMNTTGTAGTRNSISCFTCNQDIVGAKVSLSHSKTSHTSTAIPVKISELMGEDFLVILTGDDHICKRCNNLFNLMDRLQSELTIVQNALLGHIRSKYNLPGSSDANISNDIQLSVNGVPYNEYASMNNLNYLQTTSVQHPVSNSASVSFTSSGYASSVSNTSSTDNSNRKTTKVYKCGFCNMQSKDLNAVKSHMRTHETSDPKRAEKRLAVASPVAARPIKRKLFRCQVCAVSYLDRKSCLNHIKANHSTSDNSVSQGKATGTTNTSDLQQTGNAVIDLTEDKVVNGEQETASGSSNVSQNGTVTDCGPTVSLDDETTFHASETNEASETNKASETNEATLHDESTSQNKETTRHDEEVGDDTESGKAGDGTTNDDNIVENQTAVADNESNSKTVTLDLDAMLEALHSDANVGNDSESVSEQMVPES